jgi:hypothetical protein
MKLLKAVVKSVILFGSYIGAYALELTGHHHLATACILLMAGFTVFLVVHSPEWRDQGKE